MMELVDMRDLGSREAIRVGSSPTTRTKTKAPAKAGVFVLVAIGSFQCSAEVYSACVKVFAHGENTCTAQKRRPTVWGPMSYWKVIAFFLILGDLTLTQK